MRDEVGWFFTTVAYATIAHSALVLVFLVTNHFANIRGGRGYGRVDEQYESLWGIEFSSMGSPGSRVLLGWALWTALLAFACVWRTHPRRSETHCRKCDYILKGLSEPKCPECGEQI